MTTVQLQAVVSYFLGDTTASVFITRSARSRVGLKNTFGLGGIGLNVVQGARLAGAGMIVGVDLNPGRRAIAERFGVTL